MNSVLLRPLPIQDPQRVMSLAFHDKKTEASNGFSIPDFEDIRQQSNGVFSGMAATRLFLMDGLNFNGRTENIWTAYVTGNFFSVMGVKPALGRLIQPSEGNSIGVDPVLVLSYSYWKTHFNMDRNIIGTKVTVSGRPVTIIGVAPEGFRGVSSLLEMQGYLPLSMCAFEGRRDAWTNRGAEELLLLARMKDGIDAAKVQSAMDLIARRLAQEYPQYHEGALHAYPLQPIGPDDVLALVNSLAPSMPVFDVQPMSSALMTFSGLLFFQLGAWLAAGMGILGLILATVGMYGVLSYATAQRTHEIGIRMALGAQTGEILRMILRQGVLIVALGLAIGLLAAAGMGRLVASLLVNVRGTDPLTYAAVSLALVCVALLASYIPARRAAKVDPMVALRYE